MTSQKLLLPVRVPELGPSLGKALTGSGRPPGDLPLDGFRLQLVSRLLDASGEARRLAAGGERDAALEALDSRTWLDAWERTVNGIATAVVERVNARLDVEAWAARMPRRYRRKVLLDPVELRGVSSRIGAAGAMLVPALDTLHAQAARLRDAMAADRTALGDWQDAVLTAARRLEAAWLALEEQVTAELGRWDAVAEALTRWRRPLWPVAAVGVPSLAAATWLGLVLGGYVAAPEWLRQVWAWFS